MPWVLSLHKQPYFSAHFPFITAYVVRHGALKMPRNKSNVDISPLVLLPTIRQGVAVSAVWRQSVQ